MQAAEKLSLEQIRAFLEASEAVRFEGKNREEVYGWVIGGAYRSNSVAQFHGAGFHLIRKAMRPVAVAGW